MAELTTLTGTCMDMCPEAEIIRREKQGCLHRFEILEGTEKLHRPKADKEKAVKEFARSAAGQKTQKSSELRPAHILKKTVKYLVCRILPRDDVPYFIIYEFITDRLRAIRQDLTIQRIENKDSIEIFEQIVRFHIYTHYVLSGEPLDKYDPHLNNMHFQECLKHLLVLYKQNQSDHRINFKNRSEMEAIYLLHYLGSPDAQQHVLELPHGIRSCNEVIQALNFASNYSEGNFIKMMRELKNFNFFLKCLVQQHVPSIQRQALKVICTAYSSKNCKFPASLLCQWLGYKNTDETVQICKYYGINVIDDSVHFQKDSFNDKINIISPLKQVNLHGLDKRPLFVADLITKGASVLAT